MQLAHDNSDQRRKIADRSDLDSLVKMERGKRRITFYDSNGTDFFKTCQKSSPTYADFKQFFYTGQYCVCSRQHSVVALKASPSKTNIVLG